MATAEHPITRSELREELDVRLQHYATKADLAELKSDIGNLKADLTLRMALLQLAGMAVVATIVRLLA